MKQMISVLITLVFLLSSLSVAVFAQELLTGKCGDDLEWVLDIETGELVISGSGDMYDYEENGAPWHVIRNRIKTITICDNVTSIGNYAFYICDYFTTVNIGESVTSIGNYAFQYCYSLKCVTIPNSVAFVGRGAFASCVSLTELFIGNDLTSIGAHAFYFCDKLEKVNIPASVVDIGSGAFNGCKGIANITVDAANKQYSNDEYGVLFNKDKTQLIQYPSGNKRISYKVPMCVTTIEASAFSDCDNLVSVTIPESVVSVEEKAFYDCDILYNVIIPDSVKSIGSRAFSDCNFLASVTIGKNVDEIGLFAFEGCNELTGITVSDENSIYSSDINGVLFDKTQTRLIQYPVGNNQRIYKIPRTVTVIEGYSFQKCDNLDSLTIPISVVKIEYGAFKGEYIRIPNVYYEGTKDQWEKIAIGNENKILTNSFIHFGVAQPEIPGVTYITGDLNGDKKINSSDALLILQYAVGSVKLNENAIEVADINKDGRVNSSDALLILKFAVGSLDKI